MSVDAGDEDEEQRRAWVPFLEWSSPLDGQLCPFAAVDDASLAAFLRLCPLDDDARTLVVDLGCGDGRINVAAARAAPRSRGVGVDVNPYRLTQARAAAAAAGIAAERLEFREQSFAEPSFTLGAATVVTCFLLPEVLELLAPMLARFLLDDDTAAAATTTTGARRVVAFTFAFDGWRPTATSDDKRVRVYTRASVDGLVDLDELERVRVERQRKFERGDDDDNDDDTNANANDANANANANADANAYANANANANADKRNADGERTRNEQSSTID